MITFTFTSSEVMFPRTRGWSRMQIPHSGCIRQTSTRYRYKEIRSIEMTIAIDISAFVTNRGQLFGQTELDRRKNMKSSKFIGLAGTQLSESEGDNVEHSMKSVEPSTHLRSCANNRPPGGASETVRFRRSLLVQLISLFALLTMPLGLVAQ